MTVRSATLACREDAQKQEEVALQLPAVPLLQSVTEEYAVPDSATDSSDADTQNEQPVRRRRYCLEQGTVETLDATGKTRVSLVALSNALLELQQQAIAVSLPNISPRESK